MVFNYNRPEHSMRTWKALIRNQFASETELYLYCNGPKDGASEEMKCTISSLHEQAKEYAVEAKAMRGEFADFQMFEHFLFLFKRPLTRVFYCKKKS